MQGTFIELDGGVNTASTLQSARGTVPSGDTLGRFRFFVSVVESGRRFCIWDGDSYSEAITIAEDIRRQWDLVEPVHDEVAGGSDGR